MNVIVFTGPTLPAGRGRQLLDATYLPPAAQGDVYVAAREHPWAIALIDGYFEWVPAVWHKEILWAMTEGVRVYGSSSMGALRAAELHAFGMRGVGVVFQQFADGELEDDDEVTVVHGPAADGFVQLSTAMVNVRATLSAATAAGIVDAATGGALVAIAKSLFYPHRTVERIFELGRRSGLPPGHLDALEAWWPGGCVDQKRRDAEALLRQIGADRRSEGAEPLRVGFQFQHTDAWEQVVRQIDRRPLGSTSGGATFQHDAVLDELRLRPDRYAETRTTSLVHVLALALASREGGAVSEAMLEQAVMSFRRRHGLDTGDAVAAWLAEQGLAEHELARLLTSEARAQRVRSIFEADLDRALGDVLRLAGDHAELAKRAEAKHRDLVQRGLDNPTLALAGVDEEGLWRWWFERRQHRRVPDDIGAAAVAMGFLDEAAMRRAVLREYCYVAVDAGR